LLWKKCVKTHCEDMTADFPDFLRIMKECMDCDLISVRVSPRNGTSPRNGIRRSPTARALAMNVEAANESNVLNANRTRANTDQ